MRGATTLVACRVTPRQKGELVHLVRSGGTEIKASDSASGSSSYEDRHGAPVTLAIGDGANDVPMLQAAHVGVAVHGGRDGVARCSAVGASDVAVTQFAHLDRLLLVHGARSYHRLCLAALWCVYKQLLWAFTVFLYAWTNGFSGQSPYAPPRASEARSASTPPPRTHASPSPPAFHSLPHSLPSSLPSHTAPGLRHPLFPPLSALR